MGTIGMENTMERIGEALSASEARLEKVFRECYVVERSPRHPDGYLAGAGGARTGMAHTMRPINMLERGISLVALNLPSDVPSEVEVAVNRLGGAFLALLTFFEKKQRLICAVKADMCRAFSQSENARHILKVLEYT